MRFTTQELLSYPFFLRIAHLSLDGDTSRAGDLVDLDAQAWGPNQPDDSFDNEDCLLFEDDFGWNDLRCFLKVTGNGKPNKPLCQK